MVLARIKQQRGVTLIIVVGVVAIVILTMLAKWAMSDLERKLLVQTNMQNKLAKIDKALLDFVVQRRRLPCPADGTIPSGAINAGLESPFPATGTCNPVNQIHGVIPWVTLGLLEGDAIDSWNGRFTYRVDPALAGIAPLLMDMSNCDNSGTGSVAASGACKSPVSNCAASPSTCTAPSNFLTGKGIDVWDGIGGAAGWAARQNNRATGTGAAYVIISHGATGAGAYNSNGIYQPGTIGLIAKIPPPGTQLAGDDEIPNLNNQALALPSLMANTYRDAPFDKSRSTTNFDDYLSHPTISSVLKQANLGARIH
ncbi:hypothetical protein [Undibacterium sp. RuTC16W]|uniref:hypothetical protein n=1 Tax=Undibacterium sp. RuTC16W TaxID=3413048 RepID=UPI003BF30FF0